MILLKLCFIVTLILSISYGVIAGMKDWEFNLDKFEFINDVPDKFQSEFKLNRIKRGVYGIKGYFTLLGGEFDDKTTVEVNFYRSSKRNEPYQASPYTIPKQGFYDYMNNGYKKYVMEDIKQCSTMPYFEGTWNKPLPKDVKYEINNCIFNNTESFPDHMQPGFYKVVTTLKAEKIGKIQAVIIVEVTTKLM